MMRCPHVSSIHQHQLPEMLTFHLVAVQAHLTWPPFFLLGGAVAFFGMNCILADAKMMVANQPEVIMQKTMFKYV